MATQIKLRRGTASEWTSFNPVLAEGEAGFETDTNKLKIGDGATNWTSLEYLTSEQDLSAYAAIIDPIFTNDIQVNGQINLTGSSAYITNFYDYMSESNVTSVNSDGSIFMQSWDGDYSDKSAYVSTRSGKSAISSRIELVSYGDNGEISLQSPGTGGKIILSGETGEYLNSSGSANQIATISDINNSNGNITSILTVSASTSPYIIGSYEKWVRFGTAGSGNQAYVTFPSASSNTNREIVIINTVYGVGVKSMSSNVRDLTGTVTDTVFSFEPGKNTVTLVSDGQYWTIVSRS